MRIAIDLHWGLKNADIDTELMPNRKAFNSTLKDLGRVTLATIKFPDTGVEFDLEFLGGSLKLKKIVENQRQTSEDTAEAKGG